MTTNLNLGEIVQLGHEVRVKQAQRGWQAEVAARATQQPAAWATLRRCIGNAFVGVGERLRGTKPVVAGQLGQEAV
ncbi:MAG: hypothetical protein ACRDJH_03655 [Thermomicrobiales bacterium]